jgi:hypothetical protein
MKVFGEFTLSGLKSYQEFIRGKEMAAQQKYN